MAYSTINKGASYFNTVTYTGNSTNNRAITGVGFKPDWVWAKARSIAYNGAICDSVRGTGQSKVLVPSSTGAEGAGGAVYGNIASYDVDGFTTAAGTDGGNPYANNNESPQTYVAWNWLGANSTTSNTSGTITSTVSANTTSGFSIVSYTGNGTASATVGHGLGVAPKMIIVKNRSTSATWMVGHSSLTWASQYMQMSDTSAVHNDGATYGFKATPTSTVFQWSSGDVANNGSGSTYIAYCFAEVKGYSKFGSYTGNGSTDGTFVYTGFKPRFLMIKRTDTTSNWFILDTARDTYNVSSGLLFPNLSDAEDSSSPRMDILSNGFKNRQSTVMNASSGTFIYMAFAENPFVLTDGTPVTAR
jgi:hypothetical protein